MEQHPKGSKFQFTEKIAFNVMIFHVFLLILIFNYKTNFLSKKKNVTVKALEERELYHIRKRRVINNSLNKITLENGVLASF